MKHAHLKNLYLAVFADNSQTTVSSHMICYGCIIFAESVTSDISRMKKKKIILYGPFSKWSYFMTCSSVTVPHIHVLLINQL